jgi:hypothetical protein
MDIFIYGTKGGAQIFHQTSQEVASLFSDCRKSGIGKNLGKVAFSIEYTKKGVAYTKWIIVDDVVRGSIGFIAFAIEIENGKKLVSKDLLALLDILLRTYRDKYLTDSFEIKEISVDWSFVKDLRDNYQTKLALTESIGFHTPGSKDEAFIYYSSEEELQKYFDVPYQDDYNEYKRVFFINEKYKGREENPLKALRHSEEADLTDRKILENIDYQISILSGVSGISTTVTNAGVPVQKGSLVHPEDSLTINFSKRYHDDESIPGTLKQLKESGDGRVKVNENNTKLTITPPNFLDPHTHVINFQIENSNGQKLEDFRIALKSIASGRTKHIQNEKAKFVGDELGEKWELLVDKKTRKEFEPSQIDNTVIIRIKDEQSTNRKEKGPEKGSSGNQDSNSDETFKKEKSRNWLILTAAVTVLIVMILGGIFWKPIKGFVRSALNLTEVSTNHVSEGISSETNENESKKDEVVLKEGQEEADQDNKEQEEQKIEEEVTEGEDVIPEAEEEAPETEPMDETKEKVNSSKTTSLSKEGSKKQTEFENEFLGLIRNGNQAKEAYDNLIKKYSDISYDNKIKIFYDERLSSSKDFQKFKDNMKDIKVIYLKRVKSLEELKELIDA